MMLKLTKYCTILLLLVSCSSFAAAKLQKLDQKIQHIKTTLSIDQTRKSELQQKLQSIETQAGTLSQRIRSTAHKLQAEKKVLKTLEAQQQKLTLQAQQQQKIVSQQLLIMYQMGPQPELKLLLDQASVSQTNRIMNYYEILTQQNLNTLQQYQATLKKLQTTEQQQLQQYQKIRRSLLQLTGQRDNYKELTRSRRHLIARINSKIKTHQQQLRRLLNNKAQLEHTVRTIENNQYINASGKAFSRLQGKLRWPNRGRLVNLFGRAIDGSQIKWGAVIIRAPQGQPVHAIADGKVVFAKWLEGYGLLVIINHGHGYMSLYGRNQALYCKAGDIVHAGDLIATVGKTGGYQQTGLYFAIRHNGSPLNPTQWCHA